MLSDKQVNLHSDGVENKKTSSVTPQEKVFAKVVAETGDIRAASIEAYGKKNFTPQDYLTKGEDILLKPSVQKKILEIWDKMGLTVELAAQAHLKVIKNKKTRQDILLKAVQMVYDQHNENDPKNKRGEISKLNVLQIFVEARKERGLTVPKQIQEALEEIKKGELINEREQRRTETVANDGGSEGVVGGEGKAGEGSGTI